MPRSDSTPPGLCVYFIQVEMEDRDGPIKIGQTAGNPLHRLRDLQVGCPWTLVMLATIPGARPDAESRLHDLFRHCLMRGEWFAPQDDLLAYIAHCAVPWGQDGEPAYRFARGRHRFDYEHSLLVSRNDPRWLERHLKPNRPPDPKKVSAFLTATQIT